VSIKQNRIRRQHLQREAEGYLELIVMFDDLSPMEPEHIELFAERSLRCLDELEKKYGSTPRLLFLKGQAYRIMGRFSQAIFYLKQSSQFESDNIETLLSLAWCYKRTGRLDLAVAALEQALEVDYSQAIIHYNLACYWALAGQVELAVKHLSVSFDIDGEYRDLVAIEDDFNSIRHLPEFLVLVAVVA